MSEIVLPVIDYEMTANSQIFLSQGTKVNSDLFRCSTKTPNPKDKQMTNVENQTNYSRNQQNIYFDEHDGNNFLLFFLKSLNRLLHCLPVCFK